MVTFVGTQSDFFSALKDLLELEYDAVETYEAAINRIAEEDYKKSLSSFKADHERHIKELTKFLEDQGKEAPHGPSGKQILTIGKVAIAKMLGTKSILNAMHDTEEDTNIAYERVNNHNSKVEACSDILQKAWEDEKRHKAWISQALEKLS